jgi:hypothetical protein
MELIVIFVIFCVVPALITRSIGISKNRDYGTAYGLLLGWLGVLAIVVLPALPPHSN